MEADILGTEALNKKREGGEKEAEEDVGDDNDGREVKLGQEGNNQSLAEKDGAPVCDEVDQEGEGGQPGEAVERHHGLHLGNAVKPVQADGGVVADEEEGGEQVEA